MIKGLQRMVFINRFLIEVLALQNLVIPTHLIADGEVFAVLTILRGLRLLTLHLLLREIGLLKHLRLLLY
jgi:hypothetical protein